MTTTASGPTTGVEAPGDVPDLGVELALDRASAAVSEHRARLRELIDAQVAPLIEAAERDRRFPRRALAALGAAGVLRERWNGGPHGDLGRCVLLSEELGRAALGGVGVGISLHLDAAAPLLRRFARTDLTRDILDRALDGTAVCCVATSEQLVGSDLSSVGTRMQRDGDGWRIEGTKWFVSPGAAADFALVLCAAEEGPAVVAVPREGLTVVKRLETAGMRGLETVRLTVDARVGKDAVLAPPRTGLAAVMTSLTYERLAIAAQTLGALDLAVTLAATHLRRRRQFGVPLHEHQALRLRMADLSARTTAARRALYATVTELAAGGPTNLTDIAGLKVSSARLAERVASECMHMFGGRGYLEDATPMSRLWRDLRVGRVGGGTDEMMWELVASGIRTDDALYERWISE
ncbi:acyl-CoA dehydrogenase family protein [Actinomadura macrotermitis]|uniref:Acyl-[acyl-carrier-protein] dehydrogenase MbtN n=1 Tax=Actinomadura macrotermitis TaxID=2585200 RepID=A0A7K0BV64_9ACTN|nr:acyl-CoA dehydrogenase family protein [Actinomadura macrotermitis]MQY05047.1 Acyl-[acyl-carrier-protein] dehydrogenase MbtN [Actinomadura macrotermitis]